MANVKEQSAALKGRQTKLVEKCKEELISKMKELKYNSTTCYSVAAIALFLDTLSRDEKEEILDILNLQEK